VKYTLEPWLVRWEQSIQRTLFSPEEKKRYFAKFNVEGLLRGDYASRMSGYATARQNGWMSANDIRELGEHGPHPCRGRRRPVPDQWQYAPAWKRRGFCKYRNEQ